MPNRQRRVVHSPRNSIMDSTNQNEDTNRFRTPSPPIRRNAVRSPPRIRSLSRIVRRPSSTNMRESSPSVPVRRLDFDSKSTPQNPSSSTWRKRVKTVPIPNHVNEKNRRALVTNEYLIRGIPCTQCKKYLAKSNFKGLVRKGRPCPYCRSSFDKENYR